MPLLKYPRALLGLAALAWAASAAATGSVTVSPVRVDLRAGQQSASIEITNTGSARTQFTVERLAWTGGPDGDRLDPTQDFVASPPLFDIEPGGRQVVRILMLRPADPQRQLTYRIALQESPPQGAAQGISTVLRLSLPIFVTPPQVAADLQWRRVDLADGPYLEAENRGTATAQVAALQLDSGRDLDVGTGYLLPGQSRRWRAAGLGGSVAVTLANGSKQVVELAAQR